MKKSLCTLMWVVAAVISTAANAQTTTTYEDGPNGVKFRVTRQVVQRTIPTTEYQARAKGLPPPNHYRVSIVPADVSDAGHRVPSRTTFTELVESVRRSLLDE